MRILKISLIHLLLISIIFSGIVSNAAQIPNFSINSTIISIATNSEFNISIEGNDISDLYAVEFELKVDKNTLKIKDASSELENVFKTSPIQEDDSVFFGYTKIGKNSSENGSLKLCSLTFNTLKAGKTNIELKTIKVVHSNLEKEVYEANKVLSITVTNNEAGSTEVPTPSITPLPAAATATQSNTVGPTSLSSITPTPTAAATQNNTAQSTPTPTAVSSPVGNGPSSWIGWLIDYDCVGANPYTHTQDCNLMPTCIASGFGIYVYSSGKAYSNYGGEDWIPFDSTSQVLADKLNKILSDPTNAGTHLGKYPNRIPTIKVNGYLVNYGLPSGISDYSKAIHINSIEFYYIPGVSNYEVTAPENVIVNQNSIQTSSTNPSSGQQSAGATPTATTAKPSSTPSSGFATITTVPSNSGTTNEPNTIIPAVNYKDFENHWARDYIEKLISKGIISGYKDGSIRPEQLISRAETAKLLVLSLNFDTKNYESPNYKDWSKVANWAKPYAGILSSKSILKGYKDNTVRADKNITRAEFVTILLRALNIEPSEGKIAGPVDADKVPEWAAGYVQKSIELGIIGGYTDNTLRVSNPIKRGEAFKILVKALEAH